MAKFLAWVTIAGLVLSLAVFYYDRTNKNPAEQLEELRKQTQLIHELLDVQMQLLEMSKDSIDVNRRIAEIEDRLTRLESGPQAAELQRQLDDLERRQRDNEVATHDLKYRIHDIEVELKQRGVDPSQYTGGASGTTIPTLPPLDIEDPSKQGGYPDAGSTLGHGLVSVSAAEDWQPSGVEVVEGQQLWIAYEDGAWSRCTDPPVCPDTGPDGDNMESEYDSSNIVGGCKHAALIARVGSAMICVGAAYSGPSPGTGPVELRINDRVLEDNRGGMTIRVDTP